MRDLWVKSQTLWPEQLWWCVVDKRNSKRYNTNKIHGSHKTYGFAESELNVIFDHVIKTKENKMNFFFSFLVVLKDTLRRQRTASLGTGQPPQQHLQWGELKSGTKKIRWDWTGSKDKPHGCTKQTSGTTDTGPLVHLTPLCTFFTKLFKKFFFLIKDLEGS